jgi:hypothetical protein
VTDHHRGPPKSGISETAGSDQDMFLEHDVSAKRTGRATHEKAIKDSEQDDATDLHHNTGGLKVMDKKKG